MPRGLIPEALVQQSELIVWTNDMSSKHDSCAICHEVFNATIPDICRVLDCSHVFHAKCVDLWFIKATFCPLCKSDLKMTYRHTSSQRSLGRSSHTSSQMSLGDRSHASSLRSGQILVGHSNSDPALLRILQESPYAMSVAHRISPPHTPDRQYGSTASLAISFSDRSLPVMGSSRSERSLGILSSNSSGPLPAVQELSDEARLADVDSQQSQSSNPPSPQQANSGQDEQNGSEHSELWRPLIDATADETLCSVASTTELQQSMANTLDVSHEIGTTNAQSDVLEASCVTPVGITPSSTVVTGTSSQERPRAATSSVARSNSWINSRSNVGFISAGRGNGVSKLATAHEGKSTLQSSPVASVNQTLAGYGRSRVAAHMQSQTAKQSEKIVQIDELSSSYHSSVPSAGSSNTVGTPPTSSVVNPSSDATQQTSTTCQPSVQTGSLAAATSTANTTILSGLATPPSIGVATMSISLSGGRKQHQPRNYPFSAFGNCLQMVTACQQPRNPAVPAIPPPHQSNAPWQR